MFEAKEIIHQNNDWITLVFVIVFIVLAWLKVIFKDRLLYSSKFFLSRKYLSIYYKKGKIKFFDVFQTLLFMVQILVLSLLFYLANTYFQLHTEQMGLKGYMFIFYWVGLYFSLRYLVGLLLAFLFNLKKEYSRIVFHKINYFNNLILWVLPFAIFSVYTIKYKGFFLGITFSLFVLLLILRYSLVLKNNKNFILNNFFYFILYLCALEIAPLIIVLKLSI